MRNKEKEELTKIVKQIPETELGKKVSVLHRRYAPSFCYNTFREYLHTFRRDKSEEIQLNDLLDELQEARIKGEPEEGIREEIKTLNGPPPYHFFVDFKKCEEEK